tara:strand:+ start:47 stop:1174 length:1128 start_codon:yes stop_codon:yes gene_type:complete
MKNTDDNDKSLSKETLTTAAKQLFLMCSINPTGYSIAAVGIAKALYELGYDIKYHNLGGTPLYDNDIDKNLLSNMLDHEANRISNDAPCVRIWHQFSLDTFVGKGPRIGYPIFELDKFSDLEKWHLDIPDKLFVCSKWGQEIIKEQTGRDSYVVPLGVDTHVFKPGEKERDTDKTFTFINIGKWEVRKGHDILADIFNKAFKPDDNVHLNILAPLFASEQERKDWHNFYRATPMGEHITFLDRVPAHADVAAIMQQADAGIFPNRGEGWNLELLELMACGKPVIATNYSGHTEFCTPENCRLVEPAGMELAYDGKWFYGQGSWARLDDQQIDEFAEQMRLVFEDWQFNQAGVDTANAFTWKNSAKKLLTSLETVV